MFLFKKLRTHTRFFIRTKYMEPKCFRGWSFFRRKTKTIIQVSKL